MKLIITAIIALLTVSASAQPSSRISFDGQIASEKWVHSHFGKGQIPPFSFVLDGRNSEGFIRRWKHSIRQTFSDNSQKQYEAVWSDPVSGLELSCDITLFSDFDAVEWTLHFTNRSSVCSSVISDAKSLDCVFAGGGMGPVMLYTAEGSNSQKSDFRFKTITMSGDREYSFSPTTKGSSDGGGFPYFNLHSASGKGVMVAIGWSGLWRSSFMRQDGKGDVIASAGMKEMKLFLHPGESIRTPKTVLMFWNHADKDEGQNEFRQFFLTHHTRHIDGKVAPLPFCGGFDWGDPKPCSEYGALTETLALAIAERYQMFGIMPNVMWLDAGWYKGSGFNLEGRTWYNTVGDWTPDPSRFPKGFRKLSDTLHGMGSRLMVWFEPEIVEKGTTLYEAHPEWYVSSSWDPHRMLIDFRNEEAFEFICKHIGDVIEENGIDYLRQDFNIEPVPYWTQNEEPGRVGMMEIRHVEHLYAFWDYMLERFPDMQIDNCAGGGRRLDIEALSRTVPLWRSDYGYGEPNGPQNQTYDLCRFIPIHGTGIYSAETYKARSVLSPALVMNWELFSDNGFSVQEMHEAVARYKRYSPLFLKDYYPLTGDGDMSGDDVCLSWQLNDAENGFGAVAAFRRGHDAPQDLKVYLRGLIPEAVYEFNDDVAGRFLYRRTGRELMEDGLEFHFVGAPSSFLIEYNRL